MRYLLSVSALMILVSSISYADEYTTDRYVTAESALLCTSPFKLNEAEKANGDKVWLRELGCAIARPGLPAIRISVLEVDGRKTFQVRVTGNGGVGITVYGRHGDFN